MPEHSNKRESGESLSTGGVSASRTRKPPWIRMRMPSGSKFEATRDAVHRNALETVCESAQCPNLGACWSRRHMTAMILGNLCTRNCRFCNVQAQVPEPVDPDEPRRVAVAVAELGLENIVITSVTRDDLPDGGAAHWVSTIEAIRAASPAAEIEVLIPDFAGNMDALQSVIETRPEIFGYNLETVPRLYGGVRHADYGRSLGILRRGADAGLVVKTSLMVGLGEDDEELFEALRDARSAGVSIVYIGQYLQPSKLHAPVMRYVSPAEFLEMRDRAMALGFETVRAAPLLRSSTPAGVAEIEE